MSNNGAICNSNDLKTSRTFYAVESMIIGEIFEHAINWRPKLVVGEIIVTSTWETDSVLSSVNESFTDDDATIWLEGTEKKITRSKNTIVTNTPRTYIGYLVVVVTDEIIT